MEKFQNLEVISNDGPLQPTGVERRRRPRLNLTSEQFRLSSTGKIFPVADLSLEGMAFRIIDRMDLTTLPVQMEIEGTLNLKGDRYPVKARVKHLGGQVVGCKFENLEMATQQALRRFLDPELLGRDLRPIPTNVGQSLWYHGSSGTDLLFTRPEAKGFLRFTVYVLGSFIQSDRDEGVSTGRVRSSDNRSDFRSEEWGLLQFETMVMTSDSRPDPLKLSVAKAVILSSNLAQELKDACVAQLVRAVPAADQKP